MKVVLRQTAPGQSQRTVRRALAAGQVVVSGARARPATMGLQEAAVRMALVSGLFVALYLACNQVSHARGGIAGGVFEWERGIPFVPWTVVPYLSIFAFFVLSFVVDRGTRALNLYCAALVLNLALALACYACVPLQFTFERPRPDGVFGPFFELLHAVDLPYNRAPSLHISVLVLLWWRLRPGLGPMGRIAVGGWFALIALSVLTTYQHHVIDIPAGVAAAWASLALARRLPASSRRLGNPRQPGGRSGCGCAGFLNLPAPHGGGGLEQPDHRRST